MRMRHIGALAMCIWVAMGAAVTASGAANGPALVQVGWTDVAPVIDGKLDDACWQNSAVLTPFVLNNNAAVATQQTVGYMCWDAVALYIGFECQERALLPMSQQLHLVRKAQTRRDGAIWQDDSIELFIRPTGSGDYYHLSSNMNGARFDGRNTNAGYDAEWRVAASADDRAWYLEFAIPWAALEADAPAANTGALHRPVLPTMMTTSIVDGPFRRHRNGARPVDDAFLWCRKWLAVDDGGFWNGGTHRPVVEALEVEAAVGPALEHLIGTVPAEDADELLEVLLLSWAPLSNSVPVWVLRHGAGELPAADSDERPEEAAFLLTHLLVRSRGHPCTIVFF